MGNSLIENPLAEVADLEGNIYDGNLDTKGITSLVCHHQIIEEVRQQIRLAGKITVTTCLPPRSNIYQQRYLMVFPKGNNASSL